MTHKTDTDTDQVLRSFRRVFPELERRISDADLSARIEEHEISFVPEDEEDNETVEERQARRAREWGELNRPYIYDGYNLWDDEQCRLSVRFVDSELMSALDAFASFARQTWNDTVNKMGDDWRAAIEAARADRLTIEDLDDRLAEIYRDHKERSLGELAEYVEKLRENVE